MGDSRKVAGHNKQPIIFQGYASRRRQRIDGEQQCENE